MPYDESKLRWTKARKSARLHFRNLKTQSAREPLSLASLSRMPRDNPGAVRAMLRAQASQARSTKDILQIVAIVSLKPCFWNELGLVQYSLLQSMYRMRAHETDIRILTVVMIVFKRFKMMGLNFEIENLGLGLSFAARARSLKGMKLFLREMRQRGLRMHPRMFREVVSKFSIGHRNLGQIRNGSWDREELKEVLLGFRDEPTDEPPFHLETFVNSRDDYWEVLAGWIAVLAWCRAEEQLWKEWELWKVSRVRLYSGPLIHPAAKYRTVRVRGDCWFVEQFLLCENYSGAWRVFWEEDMRLGDFRASARRRLLDAAVYSKTWTAHVIEALERRIDEDIIEIISELKVNSLAGSAQREQYRLY